jgi:hypothetical protein
VLLAITSLDPASVYREDETICDEKMGIQERQTLGDPMYIMPTLQYILEEPRPP